MENVVPQLSRDLKKGLEERPEADTSCAEETEQLLIQVSLTPIFGLSVHFCDKGKA